MLLIALEINHNMGNVEYGTKSLFDRRSLDSVRHCACLCLPGVCDPGAFEGIHDQNPYSGL